jgi:hypothetical protein
MLVIPDDDMVEDINADDLPGFHQSFCQADILLGGGNITGRMIMHKDDRGRAGRNRLFTRVVTTISSLLASKWQLIPQCSHGETANLA